MKTIMIIILLVVLIISTVRSIQNATEMPDDFEDNF